MPEAGWILDAYPPVDYPTPWRWVAVALLLACVLLPLLAWLLSRPRRRTERPAVPVEAPSDLRQRALAAIDEVARQHAAGDLTDRAVHARLSAIVREFVAGTTGGHADALTLAELRERVTAQPQLAPLTDFVAEVYAPVFAPDARRDVAASLRDAERLVSSWR